MSETPKTPLLQPRNLCQSRAANIGTALAQAEGPIFGANKNPTCQTTLAQQKPLILLGEMHFCANFQNLLLIDVENIFLIKNTIKNFRTRPRVRAHTRHLLPRARARYSIRRISENSPRADFCPAICDALERRATP